MLCRDVFNWHWYIGLLILYVWDILDRDWRGYICIMHSMSFGDILLQFWRCRICNM